MYCGGLEKILKMTLILVLSTFSVGCTSLMYHPSKNVKFYDPAQMELKEEDVWFHDGRHKLHAWWFSAKTEKPIGTVIFFHGNAQNITSHFANLAWLPAEGYNYFIFDYPGYGLSEGSPSPKSCVQAGKAAIRWVSQNRDSGPLIVFGASMGGITAMRAVEEIKDELPIKALVLDSTFPSYQGIARKKLRYSWVTWWMQPLTYFLIDEDWAPNIRKLHPIPLLIVHGNRDFTVEPEFSDQIFEAALEPKTYWKIEDGIHTDMFFNHGRVYRRKFLAWLSALEKQD